MNWSQFVREGMRSANACDPPNESFFLSVNAPWPCQAAIRSCQLNMADKLLFPAPLGDHRPTGTLPLALEFDAPGREPMFKTLIQEAAALASLALFIAMIAIWTQVWKICDRSRRTAAACHHRSGIAWCCRGSRDPRLRTVILSVVSRQRDLTPLRFIKKSARSLTGKRNCVL